MNEDKTGKLGHAYQTALYIGRLTLAMYLSIAAVAGIGMFSLEGLDPSNWYTAVRVIAGILWLVAVYIIWHDHYLIKVYPKDDK